MGNGLVGKTLPHKHEDESLEPSTKKTSGRCADPCVTLIVGVLTCVYIMLGGWRCSPDQAAWLDEVHQ